MLKKVIEKSLKVRLMPIKKIYITIIIIIHYVYVIYSLYVARAACRRKMDLFNFLRYVAWDK